MNALSRWKQRIERMEQRLGIGTKGPQAIYFMPSLEAEDDGEETPRRINVGHGMYAYAFGAPFTDEQIAALKKELTPEEMAARFKIPAEWLDVYRGKKREPNLIGDRT